MRNTTLTVLTVIVVAGLFLLAPFSMAIGKGVSLITKEELKKVFGGALTFNQNMWTTSNVRIFRKPPTFMEKNSEDEHIFL